jgi:hypothetical protein
LWYSTAPVGCGWSLGCRLSSDVTSDVLATLQCKAWARTQPRKLPSDCTRMRSGSLHYPTGYGITLWLQTIHWTQTHCCKQPGAAPRHTMAHAIAPLA